MNEFKNVFVICSWLFLGIVLGTQPANAACEIEDIVDMVEDGVESSEIRKDCDREVVDAGECSIFKVIRLADREGMDADEIHEECSSDNSPGGEVVNTVPVPRLYCCNAYTGIKVCEMAVALPVGSVCTCSAAPGAGLVCL